MQFTTDWILPTRVAQDDSVGDTAWVETDKLFIITGDSFDGAYSFFTSGAEVAYLDKAHLVFNDAVETANNEASGTDTSPFSNLGGASDLWGESSLNGSQVNGEKFGVAIATGIATSGVPSGTPKSYYLLVTGFTNLYSIPDDATIDGIEVEMSGQMEATGGGTTAYKLDYIRIRVTYTWDIQVTGEASSYGGIFVDPPNRQLPQKQYRYKVRSASGDYLGNWKDLSSDPTYKQDINNLIGSMPISFARNDLTYESSVDQLLNEDSSVLTDENDSPFLIDTSSIASLGDGTNLDTNLNVEVDAIYGQFEPLLNEDDTPILNEDGSMLLVEEGYPLGRTIFRGYIPRWELPLDASGVTSEIRSYSQDLANEPLTTVDTVYVDNGTITEESYGISGSGPTDITALYQTFTMAAEKVVSKVRLYPFAGWFTDVPFTVSVYSGTPSSPGTLLGIGSGSVNRNELVPYYDVVFNAPITLPAASYYFQFSTPFSKTGGNVTYPLNFYKSTSYGGGSAYYFTDDTGLVASGDIAFQLFEAGADTTVPFNSYDPSDILREIVDFARGKGYPINYDSESIIDTGTTVSYTFRGQTIKDAIEKVLQLCPANWYFYYDFGTDTIYLREKSSTPDRWLRKGQTVVSGKIVKTIEQVVNDVLFTGGGDPALYKRETDYTNVGSTTRKGLKSLSDNRVTDPTTASILANAEIDNFKDPLYAGDVTITPDGTFYLEDVKVGEVYGFIGFGSLVDAVVVQSVSKDYSPDVMPLTLTYNLPRVNKRVEDIKRNLDTLETTNNPDSPS